MWHKYLLWFAHEHLDFRYEEMQSILSLYDIPIKYLETPSDNPYWIVELPSEGYAKKIASRSVLIKSCIELWSASKTIDELHINLKNALLNTGGEWLVLTNTETGKSEHICPSSLIEACCPENKSFKIEVETFCKHYTMKEKVDKIESFSYLPLKGPVKLKNPDVTLSYIEFYGVDPNSVPDKPYKVFFGRWIADGQRAVIQYHSLKKRHFIGNTSMDAQLALIMANQARVMPGDLVLDPFVGSGSLLVAAAHFGGYVWGSDIDFMMLHGRTRPTRVGQKARGPQDSIRCSLRQYGSARRFLDALVSDFSRPVWRCGVRFDAIITDPPYGVREPTEKIGIEKENYTLSEEHLVNHIPSKVEYGLPQLYGDLLEFAAEHLRKGKRLVCWYPMVRDQYNPLDLPHHPCLELVANSEQILSRLTCRRLLTYEKQKEYEGTQLDANATTHNFREKYFALGEITRREKKERRAEEMTRAALYKAKNGVT